MGIGHAGYEPLHAVTAELANLPPQRLWAIQQRVKADRLFRTDLETVKVSRLRAAGVITAASTETVIKLGDVEQTVGLYLRSFSNGGSWSLFIAPCCGRKAQTLRLMSGKLYCGRCLTEQGIGSRFWPMSARQRAAVRVPELIARLSSTQSERVKPMLWGTMEKRCRHEAALRRAQIVLRKHALKGFDKAIAKESS